MVTTTDVQKLKQNYIKLLKIKLSEGHKKYEDTSNKINGKCRKIKELDGD